MDPLDPFLDIFKGSKMQLKAMRSHFKTLMPFLILLLALPQSWADITPEQLSQKMQASLEKCYEINLLKKKAEELGVKVTISGVTAAYIARYVKNEMEEQEKRLHEPTRPVYEFNYDYYSIFDKKTPFEITVDKKNGAVKKLKAFMLDKFPHLAEQGSQGPVLQIIHNEKSKDRVTSKADSLSEGQIALDGKIAGLVHSPVQQKFLLSIVNGQSTYHFRPGEMENPGKESLYSLVNYLKNTFRLQMKIRSEVLDQIKVMIKNLNREKIFADPEIKSWLRVHGEDLFKNSADMAYSFNTIDELGLRDILQNIDEVGGPLQSWLERRPLHDRPLGSEGRTLQELGEFLAIATDGELEPYITNRKVDESDEKYQKRKTEEIALLRQFAGNIGQGHFFHDIKFGYEVYKNMAMGPDGRPNALITVEPQKRSDMVEAFPENRNGFYTLPGRKGERLFSGPRMVLQADPNAREGVDFSIGRWLPGEVIFYNRQALRIAERQTNRNCTPAIFFTRDWGEGTEASLMSAEKTECEDMVKRRIWADEDEWKKTEHLFRGQGPQQEELWDRYETFLKMGRAEYQPDLSVLMDYCETRDRRKKIQYADVVRDCAVLSGPKRIKIINDKLVKNMKKLAQFSDLLQTMINSRCFCDRDFMRLLKLASNKPVYAIETFRLLNKLMQNKMPGLFSDLSCIKDWSAQLNSQLAAIMNRYPALAHFAEWPACHDVQNLRSREYQCMIDEVIESMIKNI